MNFTWFMKKQHQTAKDKGWWDVENPFGDQVANMHAELAEVWEEYRVFGLNKDYFLYATKDKQGNMKPEGIAAEFADVIIRICDTCYKYDVPLEQALHEKSKYNQSRPYRHGNKHA